MNMRDMLELLDEAVYPSTYQQLREQLDGHDDEAKVDYRGLFQALLDYKEAMIEGKASLPPVADSLDDEQLKHELGVLKLSVEGSREEQLARLGEGWKAEETIVETVMQSNREKEAARKAAMPPDDPEALAAKEKLLRIPRQGTPPECYTYSSDEEEDLIPKKLKVAELREELEELGLDTKGKKSELIERLSDALGIPVEEPKPKKAKKGKGDVASQGSASPSPERGMPSDDGESLAGDGGPEASDASEDDLPIIPEEAPAAEVKAAPTVKVEAAPAAKVEVAPAKALPDSKPGAWMVGKSIEIRWEGEETDTSGPVFFTGEVKEWDGSDSTARVVYHDGEEHWHAMLEQEWRLP